MTKNLEEIVVEGDEGLVVTGRVLCHLISYEVPILNGRCVLLSCCIRGCDRQLPFPLNTKVGKNSPLQRHFKDMESTNPEVRALIKVPSFNFR